MGYTSIMAKNGNAPHPDKKSQHIDFIEYFKKPLSTTGDSLARRTPEQISALFRDFNVNTSGYTFNRDDANAR